MKKKIAVIANNDLGLYNFRKELLERLLREGYAVTILLPDGEKVRDMQAMGCAFEELAVDRRGTNPFRDFKLFLGIIRKLMRIRPDTVLTYTVKPNIYGGMAARLLHIPYIANITGLGSALETPGLLQKITMRMYRTGLKKAGCVFCQNKENLRFVKRRKITGEKVRLLPGSGVNLRHFSLQAYPPDGTLEFVFVSRVMKEKGINEYLEAARMTRKKYPNTRFHICGFCEEEFAGRLKKLQAEGLIEYHGLVTDIRQVLKDMHCAVLPSYHEGMSNALLEAAATGRVLIASNIPGCRECLKDREGGFLVKPGDAGDLAKKMEKFIRIPYEGKRKMGLKARTWVEGHFDRNLVVDAYMQEIQDSLGGRQPGAGKK